MIFSPLLKLLNNPTVLIDASLDMASAVVDKSTEAISDAVSSVVEFSPLDWLWDLWDGVVDTLFSWLPIGATGLTGIVVALLVRKVFRRQPATWLRWRVPQPLGLAAVAQFGDKQVRYSDGVLLVNAWASGEVARWLHAQGYSQGGAK